MQLGVLREHSARSYRHDCARQADAVLHRRSLESRKNRFYRRRISGDRVDCASAGAVQLILLGVDSTSWDITLAMIAMGLGIGGSCPLYYRGGTAFMKVVRFCILARVSSTLRCAVSSRMGIVSNASSVRPVSAAYSMTQLPITSAL